MLNKNVQKILTTGLKSGFVGTGVIEPVKRGVFHGQASDLNLEAQTSYHDEWFIGVRQGGGQELVQTEGEQATRLYAGGNPEEDILTNLGTNLEEIAAKLKYALIELSDQTRLDENCHLIMDENWTYDYQILLKELDSVVAAERIFYRQELVHLHVFLLNPIE